MKSMAYYYCLKHKTVEGESGCRAADRLGPYETQADASRALDIAHEKTKAWDEDPVWNDDVDEDDEPAGSAG